MSHTYTYSSRARFHCNSDLSGDVSIVDEEGKTATIPINDIIDFLADALRREVISDIEDLDAQGVFKMVGKLKG